MINHHLLRAAQSKAAIALFIGDGAMWMAAYDEMKVAIGYPWHRAKPNQHGGEHAMG
ncbi:TPA: host cell division inhibitory peptide Kil [Enterobacter kobei]